MRKSMTRIGIAGLSGRAGEAVLGCGDLATAGLIDLDGCCEVCHSADGYAMGGAAALGPCHTVLADGRAALVCCAARII